MNQRDEKHPSPTPKHAANRGHLAARTRRNSYPLEVKAALVTHDAVLAAAVVGAENSEKLVKPKAFVVLKPGQKADDLLKQALQQRVKAKLAPYKNARWIEFVSELPKTATGKIPAVQVAYTFTERERRLA